MVPKTPPPAVKKGIGAWYNGHKPEVLMGAAGIVVTVALYVRSKGSAGSSSTTAASTPTSTVTGSALPDTGNYGGGGGDTTGLDEILTQLSGQLTSLQGSSPSSSDSGQVLTGSGYGAPGSSAGDPSTTSVAAASGGASYEGIPAADITELNTAGTPTYYQPAPGVFAQTPAGAGVDNLGGLAGNTPIYVQT